MMEAAACAAATARAGVSLPMPSSQNEWRAVSDHNLVPNARGEDMEASNLGRSNGRTIYELLQRREPVDLDFGPITIEGSLDNEILQRLHGVARQREELQQMEMELRAQLIARSEIVEMQNSYEAQIKEHANAAAKLQDQLRECEQTINELERKMDAKERELHDIKVVNEAAWVKEDLLREQNKELATFRREHDNSEAERAQHLKQIHDLQDHMEEKERQFIELQEQNRIAQETILFKDEQLRDAQAWISRAQEMDALQSTTNQSLQAELRERTEQYNQLWLGSHRHFVEMETLHMHTVQQLQLELADARERSGTYSDKPRVAQSNSKDVPQIGENNGQETDATSGDTPKETSGVLSNGNADNLSSFVSAGNGSTQTNHVPGVAIVPSSILGIPTYLPPGQVAALHPFVMHQQGFHSIPAFSPLQSWQNQQGVSESSKGSTHNHCQPSQPEQKILRSDSGYDVNGQSLHPENLNVQDSQGEPESIITSSAEEAQVSQSSDKSYMLASQPQQSSQQNSSQFQDAFSLDSLEQTSETKEISVSTTTNLGLEPIVQPTSASNTSPTDSLNQTEMFTETDVNNSSDAVLPEVFVSTVRTNAATAKKAPETALLDESSLLACIVRTIPPGSSGRIRLSSTLPNRLGKMLAPLHWHDYKKKYGKLDDFVAGHPELFVIEGDYIQLQDGAQETIAATAAVAKVAAAASASCPYSLLLPSVALTPMAQSHRLKTVPSINSKPLKTDNKAVSKEYANTTPANSTANVLRHSAVQNKHSNGFSANAVGGSSNIKILSKPKEGLELNGTETRSGESSVSMAVKNGTNPDTLILGDYQNKGSSANGRPGNLSGKQQGRATGFSGTSKR